MKNKIQYNVGLSFYTEKNCILSVKEINEIIQNSNLSKNKKILKIDKITENDITAWSGSNQVIPGGIYG